MLGRGRDWLRWIGAVLAAIAAVRIGLYLVLPALQPHFAWSGAVMLGLAAVFLFLPLPHEALLVSKVPPEERPDRSGNR